MAIFAISADFISLESMILHRAQHTAPGGSELHQGCNSLVEKARMLARATAFCELRRSPRASASVAIWAICPMPAFGHYHAPHRNMPSIWDLLCSISARRDKFLPSVISRDFPRASNLGQEVESMGQVNGEWGE